MKKDVKEEKQKAQVEEADGEKGDGGKQQISGGQDSPGRKQGDRPCRRTLPGRTRFRWTVATFMVASTNVASNG